MSEVGNESAVLDRSSGEPAHEADKGFVETGRVLAETAIADVQKGWEDLSRGPRIALGLGATGVAVVVASGAMLNRNIDTSKVVGGGAALTAQPFEALGDEVSGLLSADTAEARTVGTREEPRYPADLITNESDSLEALDCAYSAYEDRGAGYKITPARKNRRKEARIKQGFDSADSDCPTSLNVSTKLRLRTLGDGQTKWRTGDWADKTWDRSDDDTTVTANVSYGMTCDDKYRDHIVVRPQMRHKITQPYFESPGKLGTETRTVYETAPMSYALKFKCN